MKLTQFFPFGVVCCCIAAAGYAQETTTWQAFWVWGSKHMNVGDGYFRLAFEVKGKVESAMLQGSGDDSYTLYVNGGRVRDGGFRFGCTDRTDLVKQLRQGGNVLAAVCRNAGYPGGWLAQLTIVYADGREQLVVSDRHTRFWHEEQPGWTTVEFDASAWEQCQEVARPPQGVWGALPIEFAGRRATLELVRLEAPANAKAGSSLRLRVVVRLLKPASGKKTVVVKLTRGKTRLAILVQPVETASWQHGKEVTLGPFSVPVNPYAATGKASLEFAIERCAFDKAGLVIERQVRVEGRQGPVRPTPARVADYHGAPTLFIGAQPAPAMFYLQGGAPVPAEYRQMAEAGYRVFSLGLPNGWVGTGKYDFGATDTRMLAALEGAPQGYFIPRVDVSAPSWWLDRHPGEIVGCADGSKNVYDKWGGTRHQSFASEPWRKDAGEALRRLIQHIRKSPYADRVIGYHLASGIYGEWHLWSPSHLPDTNEPMRRAFIAWCRRRYGGDLNQLNAAWGAELKSFDDITCAAKEERFASDLGAFKDVSRSRRVADYWRCLHETTVAAINYFCKIVKDSTNNQAVTGVFYGYLTDLGWPQEGGHLAAYAAFDSPYIDYFSSPHSYAHRALGEDAAFRAYPESLKLHGKLFMDEDDDRTHLSGDKPNTYAKTLAQDVAIMRREGLNVLTNRTGMWWFDMASGWFNDPGLIETAARLRALGRRVVARPRESYSQVAVVFDPTTYYAMADWQTKKDPLSYWLCNEQFRDLQKMGAPYDVLLLDDLFHPKVRDYRCYVFLNTWRMTGEQRRRIVERLQRGGKVLVFAYAPGFSSDSGLDAAHMTELTGLRFRVRRKPASMRAVAKAGAADTFRSELEFGVRDKMSPRFSVVSSGVGPLAVWKEGGEVAAAVAEHKNWTAVYYGTGPIPAALLADALRRAGVHLWTPAWETGASFWAGHGFMGVHTSRRGEYTFTLPWPSTVRDALTGEVALKSGVRFSTTLGKTETAIYEIDRHE